MEMLCITTGARVTWVYPFVKTCWVVYLGSVHSTLCEFCLNKTERKGIKAKGTDLTHLKEDEGLIPKCTILGKATFEMQGAPKMLFKKHYHWIIQWLWEEAGVNLRKDIGLWVVSEKDLRRSKVYSQPHYVHTTDFRHVIKWRESSHYLYLL